ncbi:MAG: methyltransferase [Propionibacteriaceae bacterium]|jgi:16S rRNA G1207 methylase RsmC|nr:methyltransferase [Propionibacteriaceae bacterium]
MTHYFQTPDAPERRHDITATIWGRDYHLTASNGVFSASRLDPGTAVLFRLTEPPVDRPARFLDLGCGIGPIAIALADHCPAAQVDAIDSNQRAVELTADNARHLGLSDRITATTPDQIDPGAQYDEIWSNPPIRIGKDALHDLLTRWLNRLTSTGHANLVVSKNLGADSLATWLDSHGWQVMRRGSAKGFRVFRIDSATSLR